jgi:hypothetical protein
MMEVMVQCFVGDIHKVMTMHILIVFVLVLVVLAYSLPWKCYFVIFLAIQWMC